MQIEVPNGYESLGRVLEAAIEQAAFGKGIERHAKAGEPFEAQKICEITRRVGNGYPLGQAIKKAEESVVLGGKRGINEILGAINYLAAAVIFAEEGLKRESVGECGNTPSINDVDYGNSSKIPLSLGRIVNGITSYNEAQ